MAPFTQIFTAVVIALNLSTEILAHGGPNTVAMNRRDLHLVKARQSLSACASKLKTRERIEKRVAKRNEFVGRHMNKKRSLGHEITPNALLKRSVDGDATFQDVSCVLAPEVTVGPYYVEGELIRDDISEGQAGIDLLLDLQFVDTNTCEVLPNSMIDFWHANTTGVYSGFAAEGTSGLTNNRGLAATDSDGVVQVTTTFPGWYQGRATHIHIAGHLNGTILSNGSYAGGTVTHIGQIFFPEDILSEVDTADVYSTNTITRLTNEQDGIFVQEDTGYDAIADVTLVGDALEDGLVATISVGVDATADYTDALVDGAGAPPGGSPPTE